ncbi:MAG: TonB-dependent receptor [Vicinamibacterales bacterium]
MTPCRLCSFLLVAVLARPLPLAAGQPAALVRGVVRDAAGTLATGATVTLLDRLATPVASTVSDPTGAFAFVDVPPGTYTLLATAPQLRSEGRIVDVTGASTLEVDLTLAAHVDERLDIAADASAPAVTTRMTLAGAAVREIPTRSRSRGVEDALATLPGWSSEDNGLLHVRGVDDGILFVQDGVPIYDRLDAQFGIAPDPAGVGTMNVLTGYIPPEYGLKAGAVVELQSSTSAQPRWTADLDAAVGGDAQRSTRAFAGGPLGRTLALGLSAAAERSDRFLDAVHPDNLHNRGGVWSGDAHLTSSATSRDLVRVHAGVGRSRHDVPHGEAQEMAGQDERQRLLQHYLSASWQHAWSGSTFSHAALYRRHVDARLRASPFDTPISAASTRTLARTGVVASVTHQRRRHVVKAGVEGARLAMDESLRFAVTDAAAAEEAGISEQAATFTAAEPFDFTDRASRAQWSAFVQDTIRASDRLTVDAGVRVDRTRLLVRASQWSPRVGVAYRWPRTTTTFRASVNRLFQPPQPEYLLLSSSSDARALSPFAGEASAGGEAAGGAAIEPERQTAWEAGVEQWVRGRLRLDVAVWRRDVRNYADPNVFLGTTIVFPNSVERGRARGVDLRLEVPQYRGWSGYVSYAHASIVQQGPVNGGLFIEDDVIEIGPGTEFTPDHDVPNAAAAGATYHHAGRGFVATFQTRHESGTPLEIHDEALTLVVDRPGADLIDAAAGRVRAHTVADVAVSQRIGRVAGAETTLRVVVTNLTNTRYAHNFGNPFSGTHFGAPRTVVAAWRARWR